MVTEGQVEQLENELRVGTVSNAFEKSIAMILVRKWWSGGVGNRAGCPRGEWRLSGAEG